MSARLKRLYYEGISVEEMTNALLRNYLTESGWLKSASTKESVNNEETIPWFTYSAIHQIEKIAQPHFRVFEFGSGSSTLWWAQRTAQVISVEHDDVWADAVRRDLCLPHRIITRSIDDAVGEDQKAFLQPFFDAFTDEAFELDEEIALQRGVICSRFGAYASSLFEFPRGYFDVIVIDGAARNLTAWAAAKLVKDSGIIIFDNSDRPEYREAYDILQNAGFRRIDFYGMGPINPYGWCTSIYTKSLQLFA